MCGPGPVCAASDQATARVHLAHDTSQARVQVAPLPPASGELDWDAVCAVDTGALVPGAATVTALCAALATLISSALTEPPRYRREQHLNEQHEQQQQQHEQHLTWAGPRLPARGTGASDCRSKRGTAGVARQGQTRCRRASTACGGWCA